MLTSDRHARCEPASRIHTARRLGANERIFLVEVELTSQVRTPFGLQRVIYRYGVGKTPSQAENAVRQALRETTPLLAWRQVRASDADLVQNPDAQIYRGQLCGLGGAALG